MEKDKIEDTGWKWASDMRDTVFFPKPQQRKKTSENGFERGKSEQAHRRQVLDEDSCWG